MNKIPLLFLSLSLTTMTYTAVVKGKRSMNFYSHSLSESDTSSANGFGSFTSVKNAQFLTLPQSKRGTVIPTASNPQKLDNNRFFTLKVPMPETSNEKAKLPRVPFSVKPPQIESPRPHEKVPLISSAHPRKETVDIAEEPLLAETKPDLESFKKKKKTFLKNSGEMKSPKLDVSEEDKPAKEDEPAKEIKKAKKKKSKKNKEKREGLRPTIKKQKTTTVVKRNDRLYRAETYRISLDISEKKLKKKFRKEKKLIKKEREREEQERLRSMPESIRTMSRAMDRKKSIYKSKYSVASTRRNRKSLPDVGLEESLKSRRFHDFNHEFSDLVRAETRKGRKKASNKELIAYLLKAENTQPGSSAKATEEFLRHRHDVSANTFLDLVRNIKHRKKRRPFFEQALLENDYSVEERAQLISDFSTNLKYRLSLFDSYIQEEAEAVEKDPMLGANLIILLGDLLVNEPSGLTDIAKRKFDMGSLTFQKYAARLLFNLPKEQAQRFIFNYYFKKGFKTLSNMHHGTATPQEVANEMGQYFGQLLGETILYVYDENPRDLPDDYIDVNFPRETVAFIKDFFSESQYESFFEKRFIEKRDFETSVLDAVIARSGKKWA